MVAVIFPALYRDILDGVAALEAAGLRADADRIRRTATATYSGAWSAAGRRRLEALVARLERMLAAGGPSVSTPAFTVPWLPGRAPIARAVAPASSLRKAAEAS